MPASNETPVRAEAFSNTIPITRPFRGSSTTPSRRIALSSMARCNNARSSAAERSPRFRRWRTVMGIPVSGRLVGCAERNDQFGDFADDLIGLVITQNEWRQQAHHLVGCDVDQQALVKCHAHQLTAGAVQFDTDHQPFSTDGGDERM